MALPPLCSEISKSSETIKTESLEMTALIRLDNFSNFTEMCDGCGSGWQYSLIEKNYTRIIRQHFANTTLTLH